MTETVEISLVCQENDLIPTYATADAAGADIKAHIPHDIILPPGESILIPTGIVAEIPKGFEIQIRPRSGLALKNQITVLNTPGTIDADYRGEIGVILINHSKKNFTITPKMRIAQLVVAPSLRAQFVIKTSLAQTIRGTGGFGHSGL